MQTKRCTICKKEKTVNNFHKNNGSKDGLDGRCLTCKKKHNKEQHKKNNPNRMWVNGKYIPVSHPLYKPGRYKTFEDAAFSSLAKYELSKEGQVYIITNPNFRDWVKVGMAVDSEDRLNGYQTSSPFRDYALYKSWPVSDRRSAESEAHTHLEKTFDRRGEWFKCTPEEAEASIAGLMESHK
jgi:hypothetical protein